ncbi:DUF433 domain-containing protein [Rhodococcus sp. WWJCD1]|uniref:DUF433 domain-containing protein n=1 Tax=Rhodococcus sp. WWJCD1 TaxID=2022519 RepID=UPI000B9B7EFD|nr:DUF433 domain-containing protein [Rhodococcus sp. WWJCD1]OZC52044.1 DUF433 domain-containing protein [Rhodococcus sp. WWJCD1]
MVDIFNDALFTPAEVSRYLSIPKPTVYYWLSDNTDGSPLVHKVGAEVRGGASVPFVALVEAYVLRSLRDMKFTKRKIRETVADVRATFDTPYALATKRIATDGIDIFVDHGGELARAGDHQKPFREMIEGYLRYITWSDNSEFASRLQLRQFPDSAPVIIDPRFGWGAPVIERNRVPVQAVFDLWQAGEAMATVAEEYDLGVDEVEAICRVGVGAA